MAIQWHDMPTAQYSLEVCFEDIAGMHNACVVRVWRDHSVVVNPISLEGADYEVVKQLLDKVYFNLIATTRKDNSTSMHES